MVVYNFFILPFVLFQPNTIKVLLYWSCNDESLNFILCYMIKMVVWECFKIFVFFAQSTVNFNRDTL